MQIDQEGFLRKKIRSKGVVKGTRATLLEFWDAVHYLENYL